MIPFITLFGEKLFLYPFMMGAAWGVGYHISKSLNQKYHVFKNFNWIFLGIFISSWLGSKLFYLLSVDTNAKTSIAQNTNFWLGGGFVFYGGLIGGIPLKSLTAAQFAFRLPQSLKRQTQLVGSQKSVYYCLFQLGGG